MQRADFEIYVNLYGSDLSRWPEELHFTAQRALALDPSLSEVLEAERVFEQRAQRSLPREDASFARRIAQVALTRPLARKVSAWAELWSDLRASFPVPKPAYTFAVLALMGFFLGALFQDDTGDLTLADNLNTMLYETGAVL